MIKWPAVGAPIGICLRGAFLELEPRRQLSFTIKGEKMERKRNVSRRSGHSRPPRAMTLEAGKTRTGTMGPRMRVYANQQEQVSDAEGASEDEEDEADDVNDWDEMEARPASNVLRDIIRWYRELVEVPRRGERTGEESERKIVEPLYRKHGWPGKAFDGDAFQVDQARVYAMERVEYDAGEPLRKLEALRGAKKWQGERDAAAMRQAQENFAGATNVDEEWTARWDIWQADLVAKGREEQIIMAEKTNLESLKPEDLPLWELKQVQMHLESEKRTVKELKETRPGEGHLSRLSTPELQERIRYAQKQAVILEKAYAASAADAENLCSGRAPSPLPPGEEHGGINLKARVDEMTEAIANMKCWAERFETGWSSYRRVLMGRGSWPKTT